MMDDMNRPFPKTVVRKIVRNRSSRNGAGVKLIVLHSTEGGNVPHSARDLEGLGSWFDNPAGPGELAHRRGPGRHVGPLRQR
jgi:hypothetical protein